MSGMCGKGCIGPTRPGGPGPAAKARTAQRRSGTADANTKLRDAETRKPKHDLDGYPHLADFRVFTQYPSYSPRLGGGVDQGCVT